MKKTLIALAAIAATSAFAQSTVTMYGNVDVAVMNHKTQSRDGSVFEKSSGVADGNWAGSRLGFRGTEDLGGGLKASFTVEQGISPTSANGFNQRVGTGAHQTSTGTAYTANNNRQSFLGLAGGFGEVRVGFQYTNSYDLAAFQGFSLSEFQGGNYQNVTHANGTRANAITYITPKMGALTLKAQVGQGSGRQTDETATVKLNNTYTSLMAVYANGPLTVAANYAKADLETAAAATAQTAPTAMDFGASYNLGVAVISATMGTHEDNKVSGSTETKAQQFSIKVPFGATDFLMSTGSAKKTLAGATTSDAKGTMVGVSYAFSKRTNIYAFTGTDKNNALTGATAGYKDNKTAVGIRHQF